MGGLSAISSTMSLQLWSLGCAKIPDDQDHVRYAARYIHDWGNGHSTRLSWAYEEMEYDWEYCTAAGNEFTAIRNSIKEDSGTLLGMGPFDWSMTNGGMVDIERDAWLISGKHNFPGTVGLSVHVPWKRMITTVERAWILYKQGP